MPRGTRRQRQLPTHPARQPPPVHGQGREEEGRGARCGGQVLTSSGRGPGSWSRLLLPSDGASTAVLQLSQLLQLQAVQPVGLLGTRGEGLGWRGDP